MSSLKNEAPSQNLQVSKQALLKAKKQQQSRTGRRKQSQNKKENAYYHVSVTKLQEAFEKQFFSHIQNENEEMMAKVQTDNLSVIKKYADYSKIKSNVERQYSQMCKI
jgi:predicted transposase YbfD/YdcC